MDEEIKKVNKKKRKVLFIILSLVFLLAAGIWEYYIFKSYDKEEKIPAKYDDIDIDFNNGKVLYINVPTSECDDTGYIPLGSTNEETIVVEEGLAWVLWQDNRNENCNTGKYTISYIKDEESLAGYFDAGVTLPLKTTTIDGIEYGFLKREYFDFNETQTKEEGIVLQRIPTITVGGYEAIRMYTYMKIYDKSYKEASVENSDIFQDSRVETYCVFDLSKIDTTAYGYLLFMGESEMYDLTVNYCEVLNNAKEFKIEVRDKE